MIVAPSMLSADFGHLYKDIDMVNRSKAGLIHLDIMDGVFVPNISYGFPVVKAIADQAKIPMDAHLMIINPDQYVGKFADLGVKWLSVHYEACPHLNRSLQNIKDHGMKAGVALNPHNSISNLEYCLEYSDYVLIMSVNPGFGGQKFIDNSLRKIDDLKNMICKKNLETLIEVDGGVNKENAPLLKKAGVDILVAGSAVFKAENPFAAIESLSL